MKIKLFRGYKTQINIFLFFWTRKASYRAKSDWDVEILHAIVFLKSMDIIPNLDTDQKNKMKHHGESVMRVN